MINKLNYGKVNGDSEELHALKGFKVLAVGNGTIGEECALSIMLMNENNVAVDLSITDMYKSRCRWRRLGCWKRKDLGRTNRRRSGHDAQCIETEVW